jgi:hypothetical protein
VSTKSEPQFLYLNTSGWKTGRQHKVEIWFVEYDGRYYIISELAAVVSKLMNTKYGWSKGAIVELIIH